ncbi:ATP-binding protein [Kitasatospora sp. NPDC047058]|uniref:GAF domain-containing sensor histidine kinase n=1 Tax=Kitasatospora sp. NPDC047058 TaxID=3155620 RepID=UPI0033FF5167
MTTLTFPRRGTPATPRPDAARTRDRRQLTAAAAVASLCLALATLWSCYVLAHLGDPGIADPRDQLIVLVYALPFAAAGMLLHAHRPGIPLGWVMLVYALAAILPKAASAPVFVEVGNPTIVAVTAALKGVCDTVRETLFFVLPLWLPSGRLTDRRWWIYISAVAFWQVRTNLSYVGEPELFHRPNPLADTPPGRSLLSLYHHLGSYAEPAFYLLLAIPATVLLARLLRAAPRHRLHLGFMLGAYLLWAGVQEVYSRYESTDAYWLVYWLFAAANLVWAVAVTHLVVKDGGWRLDRAARRILSGLLLATGLTMLFVVFAAVLSDWLVPGRGAAALLLIALVFVLGTGLSRAARWAVGLVDRLYYGERAQPYQVLRTLAGRVRQVVDPERLPDALCATVAEELRLPGVALTVSTRAGLRPLASVGRLNGRRQSFALVHHGGTIGELTVGLREGEAELDDSDVDILRSLADQASPAVASLRLQEDLQASREQIVAAREEERRWLRRDIHDGLGPALAGLRLRVDNAGSTLDAGAPLTDTLHSISGDLATAIKEVRRITDRLGPASLGEFGLTRAIEQLGATFNGMGLTVTTEVTPEPLPNLPAAVEVAAYRITAEALNNVLRHARATAAEVRVRVEDKALMLTVQDNGIGCRAQDPGAAPGTPGTVGPDGGAGGLGGAASPAGTGGAAGANGPARTDGGPAAAGTGAGERPAGSGVGLRSMADRAAELGGSFTIGPLEHGTRVLAVLPRYPSQG